MELSNPKTKIIKDNVHGYIKLEDPFWKIINTPEFQRLKWIEQSTISVLYPSAKHDRFAHSLGTFHLGQMAFDGFYENVRSDITNIIGNKPEIICNWRNSFLLACLLHDIGHVPFSHTCESLYVRKTLDDTLINELKTIDKKYFNSQEFNSFQRDYTEICDKNNSNVLYRSPKNHEVISAILTITNYATYLKCFECVCKDTTSYPSLDLVIRSILGCVYQISYNGSEKEYKNIRNCLIQLLNSKTIDVDKLDYINRDGKMSGYENIGLDNSRLLSGLSFIEIDKTNGYYFPAFKKSALNVVYTIISAREAQINWIINHPTVIYENFLLKKGVCLAINYLANKGCDENEEITRYYGIISQHDYKCDQQDSNCSKYCNKLCENYKKTCEDIFCSNTLSSNGSKIMNNFDKNYNIKLLSDVDMMYLIKQVPKEYDVDCTIEQILDRGKRKKPIWKSNAEFVHYIDKYIEIYGEIFKKNYSEVRKNIIQALSSLANNTSDRTSLGVSIPEELLSSKISLVQTPPCTKLGNNHYQHIINFLSKINENNVSDDACNNEFIILGVNNIIRNNKNNDKNKYTFIRFEDKSDYISYYDLDKKLLLENWNNSVMEETLDNNDLKNNQFVYIYSKNKIETKDFLERLVFYFCNDYSSVKTETLPKIKS